MYSSTYIPKPEEIEEKVNACFQLMHKFTADVFKKACGEWENSGQKKMPSPIDLRDKCNEVIKNTVTNSNFSNIEHCMFKNMPKPQNSIYSYIGSKYENELCCSNDFRGKTLNGYTLCEYHYVLTREMCGLKTSRLSWLGDIDGDISWTKAELMRCEYESGNVQILNKLTETQRNHVLRVNSMVEKAMKKGNLELSFIKKI
jgi:hypothetical protein